MADFLKSRRDAPISFTSRNLSYGTPATGDDLRYTVYGEAQAISTSDHPVHLLGKVRGDIGGNFTSARITILGLENASLHRYSYSVFQNAWRNEVMTMIVPHLEVRNLLEKLNSETEPLQLAAYLTARNPGPTELNLTAMGAKAVDMVKPTNSTADTANSLAELLSERKFFSLPSKNSTIEGEYLNYMFGVAPTIGLAQDLRNAIENREAIVDQTIRDSGKIVRRRMEFDSAYTTESAGGSGLLTTIGPALNVNIAPQGTWKKIKSTKSRYWFSGAFTYHLPKEGVARDLALLDKLYGVRPGLDTPWELLPFSWLIDYKASAGSAISNMNSWAQEGLVMPYGYIMCHTVVQTEYTWTGAVRDSNGTLMPSTFRVMVIDEQKVRRRANPFGFGILPGDLNAKQKSILAALGLNLVR